MWPQLSRVHKFSQWRLVKLLSILGQIVIDIGTNCQIDIKLVVVSRNCQYSFANQSCKKGSFAKEIWCALLNKSVFTYMQYAPVFKDLNSLCLCNLELSRNVWACDWLTIFYFIFDLRTGLPGSRAFSFFWLRVRGVLLSKKLSCVVNACAYTHTDILNAVWTWECMDMRKRESGTEGGW